jgi:oligoendopeptidase F
LPRGAAWNLLGKRNQLAFCAMPPVRSLPARGQIARHFTWDTDSVFAGDAEWQAEYDSVLAALPDLAEFRGHLGEGPDHLADFFAAVERVRRSMGRMIVYASMFTSVDSSDEAATARMDRARGLASRVSATLAFADPEMLAVGVPKLREWARASDRLRIYDHFFDVLGRRADHVRSDEVEEVLSMAAEPLNTAAGIHGILANAELHFPPARESDGAEVEVAQGTYADLQSSADRELRRTSWESYADAHLGLRKTMAATLAAGIKRDVFYARARRYQSSLEAALEPNHIPVEVFHNVIGEFQANLGTWHRYWRIRRRALGLERLQVYDTRAPLAGEKIDMPYEEAVGRIADGLRPLGEEYVETMRRGALEERWVDIYPNQGKRMGAFSMGVPDTKPFIFISYNNNIFSLSTLAHELGHSMHSWYSKTHQPYVYAGYGLFVAECASNFHQALVRQHLLGTSSDRAFQIGVIEEAMANFHRYFFVMPSLARFELEAHERAERGEALTADWMMNRMAELMYEVYGEEVERDWERVGITWAEFHTHLYSNFYVYQYATGIAAAHWLADRVGRGEPGAAEDYIRFISAGSSVYPLEALRLAGVDMSSREPVRKAFEVMASYVDRLDELTG